MLYGIVNCNRAHGVTAAVLFDNEEVGSGTKQGADSATLGLMLEKIACALGASRSEYIDSLASGFMLSCDVAHAKHPNHAELSDASCNAVMNKGTLLKMNYEQRYATEAVGIGMIEGICAKYSIPYQRFMNRPDLRGRRNARLLCGKSTRHEHGRCRRSHACNAFLPRNNGRSRPRFT